MLIAIDSIHDLAATIRGRRYSLGLTQEQLAARMHVSRQWVNQVEHGKRTVQLGSVLRLLDALEMRLCLDTEPADGQAKPAAGPAIDLDTLLDDYRDRDA